MDPANQGTPNINLAYTYYECPVCYEYARPPIHLCKNGHLVCCDCILQLECCPTCKGELGGSRCIPIEKMLDSILFPCKYSSAGCQVTMLLTDMSAHEEKCIFFLHSYTCILCPWKGAVEEVVAHILSKHINNPTIKLIQGNHFIFVAKNSFIQAPMVGACKVKWVRLLSCFRQHFFVLLMKKKNVNKKSQVDFFVTAVLLTGPGEVASNFTYKIKFKGLQHKMAWESTPLSILGITGQPNVTSPSASLAASIA